MMPLPTSLEKVTWGRWSLRRSRDWLVEEQAVGGRATAAGDARMAVLGDRGAGGGVPSWGKEVVATWERRGLEVAPLAEQFPGVRLKVSSRSVGPADLKRDLNVSLCSSNVDFWSFKTIQVIYFNDMNNNAFSEDN